MKGPANNGDAIHVHVVNDSVVPSIFEVKEEQFWRAFQDTPELRDRIKLTIGHRDNGLFEAAATADVLIGVWDFHHRELVKHAPKLCWIHLISAGVEHVSPFDWLPRGMWLTNSSGVHTSRAGEFAACALLMLNSDIPMYATQQRKHEWTQVYGGTIDDKVLTVVGVGDIGGEAARRAKQLGMQVRGVRHSGRPHRSVHTVYRPHQLHEALDGADFLLVSAPHTPETSGLIGATELDLLRRGAGVINLARAELVDYDALVDKLGSGQVGGAILDVFNPEPLPEDSPLWDVDNLMVTPHISSDPYDYNDRMLALFRENLIRLLAGKPLRNRVRADRGY
jgi:glyoxylate/hydroxypyruvate reductase A